MSELLLKLVKTLIAAMVAAMTPSQVKAVLDAAFDKIEDEIKDSSTHWDDTVFLPLIKGLRSALSIPDNDQGPIG